MIVWLVYLVSIPLGLYGMYLTFFTTQAVTPVLFCGGAAACQYWVYHRANGPR